MKNILVSLSNADIKSEKTFATALTVSKLAKSKLWIFVCQEGAMIGQPNHFGPNNGDSNVAWVLKFTDLAKKNGLYFALLVAQGDVRESLLKAVCDTKSNLLVLGRSDRTLLTNAFVGLSSYVLQEVPKEVDILFS